MATTNGRLITKPSGRKAQMAGNNVWRYTGLRIMTQRVPNPPPGFDDLTVDQKLDYLQSLWDRIAAKPDSVPVPDWHLDLIEERLRMSRGTGRSWNEVRDELRSRLQQRKPSQ